MVETILGVCDTCYSTRENPTFALACAIVRCRVFQTPHGQIQLCAPCRCKLLGCRGYGIRLRFRHRPHGKGSYWWDEDIRGGLRG